MLRFVTGATGAGKTKYGVSGVIEILRFTNYPILGNLELRLHPWVNGRGTSYPGLLWTLQREFDSTFDAERRIRQLDWDQLQRFYAWRLVVPEDVTEQAQLVEVPKSPDGRWHFDGKLYPACCYFIDEAHEFFKQQDWQAIGTETQSWASQNRRTGDEAWLFTQDAELVAKPFRRQSVECLHFTNWGHRSISIFRAPSRIRGGVYVRTPPQPTDKPLRKIDVTFRQGYLDGCYDTAAGAGVRGQAADIGKRAKGIHMGWLPVMFVVGMVCVALMMRGCVSGLQAAGKATAKVLTAPPVKMGFPRTAPLQQAAVVEELSPSRRVRLLPHPVADVGGVAGVAPKRSHVTGRYGNHVWLADGTDFEAHSVTNRGFGTIEIDGHLFEWGH